MGLLLWQPAMFVPARTTDPEWSLSEGEVGSPFNHGTPYPFKPSLDAPSNGFGGGRVGLMAHDAYLRLIPFPRPPSAQSLPGAIKATGLRSDRVNASRTGGPANAPQGGP